MIFINGLLSVIQVVKFFPHPAQEVQMIAGLTVLQSDKLMPLLHTFADQLGEGMSGKRKDTPQAAAPRRTVIYKEDLE